MLGMTVGEERTVPVTLPPTWEPEQLRGVRADCSVAVKEIFEWELPEVSTLAWRLKLTEALRSAAADHGVAVNDIFA